MFNTNLSLEKITSSPIAWLFLLWWMFLPFGSKILSVDLGPIVLYPTLIISVAIVFVGIKSILKWERSHFILVVFVGLWFLQGGIQYAMNPKTYLALFDLKSLILQVITALVFVNCYVTLKKELFFEIVVQGIRFYVLTLLVFGVFESFTAIHLTGNFTEKLLNLPVGSIHYAPVFLYDNPNDFVAHFLFLIGLLFILDKEWIKKRFLFMSLLVAAYFFSELADARSGKLISVMMIGFLLVMEVIRLKGIKIWLWLSMIVLLIVFIGTNTYYFGPKYKDSSQYRLNNLMDVTVENGMVSVENLKDKLSSDEKQLLIHHLDSLDNCTPMRSDNVRKNLLLNGLDFMKEKPLFGVGPGQFYQRHIDKKVEHNTGTVTSAHCFPIELIATYGLIGWIYLAFIVVLLGKLFLLRNLRPEMYLRLLLVICVFAIIWIIPSSYIYLEIYRITLPLILMVYLSNLKERTNE